MAPAQGLLWGLIAKHRPGHSSSLFGSQFLGIPSSFPLQTLRCPPGRGLPGPHGVTRGGDSVLRCCSQDLRSSGYKARIVCGAGELGGAWSHSPWGQESGGLTCVQNLSSTRAFSITLALPIGTGPGSPGLWSRQVREPTWPRGSSAWWDPRPAQDHTGPRWVLLPRAGRQLSGHRGGPTGRTASRGQIPT